jgi:zinc protease
MFRLCCFDSHNFNFHADFSKLFLPYNKQPNLNKLNLGVLMRSKIRKGLIALSLASIFAQNALVVSAQTPPPAAQPASATVGSKEVKLPAGVERVASVEGITEYRLPNGLRVLLFPDQTKQTITVNATYLVGSKHENYGETGMAHLLEHLVFKGSPKYLRPDDEFAKRGARANGTTSFDRTNYFETFPASDDNLNWALEFEADRMVNSFIAKKDLDSEMTVVRNEFEGGENNPFRVLIDKMLATAYQWHNYGNTTIGARSDIENVPIERLQAFYRMYYQPDNAVLVVAGKIDEAKTVDLVNKYFAPIPKPARALPQIYTDEPTQDGERQVIVRRTGDTQLVAAGYHIAPGSHPDSAAFSVLSTILGDTPSGRLHKALVESKKATSVFNFGFQTKEPGFVMFGAEVRKENSIDEARDILLQTIENAAANPPTAEEVERAKTKLLKNIELSLNSSDQIGIALSNFIAQGDWRLFFLNRDRIRKVTPEDVKRVAANYLKPANRTVGKFVPADKIDRAEVPNVSSAEILAMVKDYKGDAAIAAGEVFDPSPANVESRTTRTTIGGLKVAFLPKENRGDAVIANISLNFGDEKSLMNRSTAGQFAGQMLLRGTAKRTRQQIQDEFDRLKARVSIFGGATGANVSIETTRQNLPAVVRLVGEILREPAFPAGEFESLKQESLAGLETQKSEPSSVAINFLSRHFNYRQKGHPLYAATIEEQIADIKAVTLDDVKAFYKDFYGASSGQMTVVGDFDANEIRTATTEIFGNWKSARPFERIKTEFRDVAAVNQSLETPDKAQAFFVARLNLKLRDDNPDYPALLLGSYIFGESGLNSRIFERLRQKDGLSYGAGASIRGSSLDDSGTFFANAIYAPENAVKLEAAFKEEVARMLKDGFTAEEITAAKQGFTQARQVSRAQDRELASRINSYLFLDRTIAWDAELESKIQALTPEQVNTAIRKYITPDKITIVKAGDFAKAKKPAQ